jgi:hypothetical protein
VSMRFGGARAESGRSRVGVQCASGDWRPGGAGGGSGAGPRGASSRRRGAAMRAKVSCEGRALCFLLALVALLPADKKSRRRRPSQLRPRRLCTPTSSGCGRSRRPRCGRRARSGVRRVGWCGWAPTPRPPAARRGLDCGHRKPGGLDRRAGEELPGLERQLRFDLALRQAQGLERSAEPGGHDRGLGA